MKRRTPKRISSRLFAPAAVVGLLSLVGACHAQVMTETFTTTIAEAAISTGSIDQTLTTPVALHAFDKGGKIVSISLSMTTGLEQNAHTFNNDFFSAHGSQVTFQGTATLTNPFFQTPVPTYNEPAMLYNQSNGIRSGAYAPAQGVFYTPARATSGATIAPTDYVQFEGTGNLPNLNLVLHDTTNFNPFSGQVSLNSYTFRNNLTTLTVTYNYVVPGPPALGVFLPGLLGAVGFLRRRRRA